MKTLKWHEVVGGLHVKKNVGTPLLMRKNSLIVDKSDYSNTLKSCSKSMKKSGLELLLTKDCQHVFPHEFPPKVGLKAV